MKSVRADEHEILNRLNEAANESGVVLTYAHKRFFLRLLDLAEKKGENTDDGFMVVMTVQELADEVRVPKRTVIQCLNRLTTCGVLRREGRRTFPRSTTTTLVKSFYERRE